MTKLLIKRFVGDGDPNDAKVREKYGLLSGVTGVICNVMISITKLIIGALTASVAITADAMNNLSDALSSIVTIVSAKMANKPADKEHPFGHGRLEYVSAFVVAFLIMLMGTELLKSSVQKIITPQELTFSLPALIVLCLTVPVKLWMAYFNNKLHKNTNSLQFKAVVSDSLNDCIATAATIVSLLIAAFTKVNLDGYIGVIVAIIIFIAGVKMIKDILAPLLGKAPDKELVEGIKNIVLSGENIIGVHDLIVHDYGPSRRLASVHAEVPASVDIMEIHDTIDNLEIEILNELGVITVIHMDPLVVDDERINEIKKQALGVIGEVNNALSLHDFRVVDGPTHTNILFDLVTPFGFEMEECDLIYCIEKRMKKLDARYNLIVTIEHDYS